MIRPYQKTADAAGVSICDINVHKSSYIGKAVEISALWNTDNLNYSFFEDIKPGGPKCRAKNVIFMGYENKMHDESVVRFLKAGKELCKAKNQLISCSQTARVFFIAKIMSDKDGLYVQLDKVLSYKFEP